MTKRVIVADDDSHIRWAVRKMLEMRGYDVDEADNGETALIMINSGSYDLAFLDIIMPQMRGDEVLRRIHSHRREKMPIVMLTGEDDDKSIMNGYSSGATYYITKPFRARRIQDIAEYLTDNPSQSRMEELEARL